MHELAKTQAELEEIAEILLEDIRNNGNTATVSRYNHLVEDSATFVEGKKAAELMPHSTINRECMDGIYTAYNADLRQNNKIEAIVARDLGEQRFSLASKNRPLPTDRPVHIKTNPQPIA